ncbi:glycosyltransferase family 2 protein [Bifidobacterium pseudocatenulatum]|jgi:glycosyltransferase involved in cell wall biosynthesis|uniref:glycosyltransferase family 2 protein n=1 Tax=Bifidobacterium pseudocatenulatum TaxID=28026 RepID=UPI0032DEFDB4
MTDNAPWLSIIVPVYNVEKYIDTCLRSITLNDMQDVEVIIVDDGSKDNSANKCLKWANSYSNFVFIQKDNGGSVSARNLGLKRATGDWIWFIDADDCIAPNSLAVLSAKIRATKSEVLNFECLFFKDGDKPHWNVNDVDETELISASFFRKECYKNKYLKFNWSFLFKRSLLLKCMLDDNRLFDENIILYEDVLFCEKFTRHTKYVEVLHLPLYGCRHNAASVTNKRSNKSAVSGLEAIKKIDSYETETGSVRDKRVMEIGLLFSVYKLIEDNKESRLLKNRTRDEIIKRINAVKFCSLSFKLKIRYILLVTGIMDIIIRVR